MKLLVFAATPPPVHGQNVMVAAMLEGLRQREDFTLYHVDPKLSRSHEDIGRWRAGKLLALLRACVRALWIRLKHGDMGFYYVPAPGKRVALYRDWLVMAFCRPFFRAVIFHWHAVGLGGWLQTTATAPERWLTQALLGRASLSIVLAPELAHDAEVLRPQRSEIVPNGIGDPAPRPAPHLPAATRPCEILFLGAGTHEKGLFRAVAAVQAANAQHPGGFRLTFAGTFARPQDETVFAAAAAYSQGMIRHVGFADGYAKQRLFAAADLFIFPTTYPHEGMPLVLLEAMAHDVKIVTTRWRAIPGMLPQTAAWTADPDDPSDLTRALLEAAEAPPAAGNLRAHFLRHFTLEQHLKRLAEVLRAAQRPRAAQPACGARSDA